MSAFDAFSSLKHGGTLTVLNQMGHPSTAMTTFAGCPSPGLPGRSEPSSTVHELCLLKLFCGDGLTGSGGEGALREFLVPNISLASLDPLHSAAIPLSYQYNIVAMLKF